MNNFDRIDCIMLHKTLRGSLCAGCELCVLVFLHVQPHVLVSLLAA